MTAETLTHTALQIGVFIKLEPTFYYVVSLIRLPFIFRRFPIWFFYPSGAILTFFKNLNFNELNRQILIINFSNHTNSNIIFENLVILKQYTRVCKFTTHTK